jgi:fibronectin-binding autotransporter adhesin
MRRASFARRAAFAATASVSLVLLFLPNSANATRTWDGGGANANWQTAANWDGPDLLPIPGTDDLHFAGTVKTTTNNDFPAPAAFSAITFDAAAGPFTLGGNAITLGGNITNSSSNLQTVNLGLILGSTAVPVFNSGPSGLSLTGGITGAAAAGAMQEVLLQGNNGKISGALSSGATANAGIRFRVDNTATADTDSWTLGSTSTSTLGGQLFVTRGTMNFGVTGDANNAPNMTITRVTGGNTGEFITIGNSATGTGTFNMNNGSLTLNDGQNNTGTTSVRLALENTAAATGNSGTAVWNQTGGTVTLQGFNLGTSPGVFGANQSGSTTSFNITGGLLDSGTSAFMVATRGVGSLTIGGTGIVRNTGVGANVSNAPLGITINDDRQAAGNLASVGTLTLNAGGTLEAGNVRMTANRGGQAVSSVLNFNGGTLRALVADNPTFLSLFTTGTTTNDTGTVNVQSGGAIIDTNGFKIGVTTPLLHDTTSGAPAVDGGLTKNGAGTLTRTGADTYTGPTVVNAGTMLVNGTHSGAGAYSVKSGATLGGTGTITFRSNSDFGTAITVPSGGILAPGASIGTLTLDGSGTSGAVLSLAAGALLNFELNNAQLADKLALVNGATGDILFNAGGTASTSTTFSFSDLSTPAGTLGPGKYTLFSSDVANGAAYSGLTVNAGGTITGGLTISPSFLTSYPGASLQLNNGVATRSDIVLNVVPEPSSLWLSAVGLFGLGLFTWRFRSYPANCQLLGISKAPS